MQLGKQHLPHYPGILAELNRLHIALDAIHYVEVKHKEQIPRTWNETTKSVYFIDAVAVLRTGEQHALTLTELIYEAHPLASGEERI
jgi:hypothetical protein